MTVNTPFRMYLSSSIVRLTNKKIVEIHEFNNRWLKLLVLILERQIL